MPSIKIAKPRLVKLDKKPSRLRSLTDREIVDLLEPVLAGFCALVGVEKVRRAVMWWAGCDEAWDSIDPEVY